MCGCHVLARLSPWRRSPCSLGQFQASTRSRSAVTGQHSVSCTITRPMKESDLDNTKTTTTKKDKSVPNSLFYEIVDNLDSFTPSVIMKQLSRSLHVEPLCYYKLWGWHQDSSPVWFVLVTPVPGVLGWCRTCDPKSLHSFQSPISCTIESCVSLEFLELQSCENLSATCARFSLEPQKPIKEKTHLLTCLPTLHRSTLLWKLACCSKAPPTQIRPFPVSAIQSTNHDLRLNHC